MSPALVDGVWSLVGGSRLSRKGIASRTQLIGDEPDKWISAAKRPEVAAGGGGVVDRVTEVVGVLDIQ